MKIFFATILFQSAQHFYEKREGSERPKNIRILHWYHTHPKIYFSTGYRPINWKLKILPEWAGLRSWNAFWDRSPPLGAWPLPLHLLLPHSAESSTASSADRHGVTWQMWKLVIVSMREENKLLTVLLCGSVYSFSLQCGILLVIKAMGICDHWSVDPSPFWASRPPLWTSADLLWASKASEFWL